MLQCYRRRQPREVSLAEVMPVVDFLSEEIVGLDVAALVRRHPHILGEEEGGEQPCWLALERGWHHGVLCSPHAMLLHYLPAAVLAHTCCPELVQPGCVLLLAVDTSVERLRHNCRQLAEELQLSTQQLARIARKCPFLLRAVSPLRCAVLV